jgi:DNA topoisomerase-2
MTEQKLQVVHSKYKQLTDIEHVLLRAEIYAGSRQMTHATKYLLHADGQIYPDEIDYTPAALLFANEALCNSFDEAERCRQANTERAIDLIEVEVNLDNKSLMVTDNGGIMVAVDATLDCPIPTAIFGHLRTGSNYTDDRGSVSGVNGIGVKILNIFSKNFTVETADGKTYFRQTWHDHMSIADEPIIRPDDHKFTRVYAELADDIETTRMPENCYDMTWARCIEARCMELAAMAAGWERPLTVTYKCVFTDEQGKLQSWTNKFMFKRFDDYLKLWPAHQTFVIDKQYHFNVAFGVSNGALESSAIVNGLQCPWGSHINTFLDACVYHMRAFINNKYKIDVKPAKLKSYIRIISTWEINAATFAGQTKEELVSDPREFGMPVIPSEQFIKKLLRSEIMTVIIEELHNRIAAQRKAEISAQQKEIDRRTKRNILPQKLTDAANAGQPDKFAELYVVEGDSAAGGIKKFRNGETQGVFALFGKSCGNMLYADEMRVLTNKAMSALCQAMGFSFLGGQRLRYDHIIITSDADYDGYSICGLLLTFFNKFMPELIEQGRLYRLATPIMTAKNLKTGELRQYYHLEEFQADKHNLKGKDWEIAYMKGLASLMDEDYMQIMQHPKLVQIVKDDLADSSLTDWFGNDSSKRKELMAMSDLVDDDIFAHLYDEDDEQSNEDNY